MSSAQEGESESMMVNDLTEVERVDDEEDGTEDRTLRPTVVDRSVGGGLRRQLRGPRE